MGTTVIFFALALLFLPGERGLIRGQGPIGGESNNDCCPFVTVNNVWGTNAHLKGEYTLKDNKGPKPEEVCINGCIYTKVGASSSDEYCFRTDNVAGADVKCSVGILLQLLKL